MSLKEKILTKTKLKRTIFFLISDIILIAGSCWAAFLLRFDAHIPVRYTENNSLWWFLLIALVVTIATFFLQRLYSISWSFISIRELLKLFYAVVGSFLVIGIIFYIFNQIPFFEGFPRSVIFTTGFLVLILTGALRFSKRIFLQFKRNGKTSGRKILIFGAGEAGEQLVRYIATKPNTNYSIVGMIDDDPLKLKISIHGIKVIGNSEQMPDLIRKNNVEELFIAMPSAPAEKIRQITTLAKSADLQKIKILPTTQDLLEEKVSLNHIRDISIEDLLHRECVSLDNTIIKGLLTNKKVLVTGAAGSIGSTLCQQILKFNPATLVAVDFDETGIFYLDHKLKDPESATQKIFRIANICQENQIEKLFAENKPEIVFHAAAYKHVPLMEDHPHEAVTNNIFGLKNVCEKAVQHGAEKFIFISTDKAVNPSSVMGMSKRVGELVCQSLNQRQKTKFISVRFGNVLDSRGNVIALFKKQIKKGGPVEVTHPEMTRYFMVTSEAVLLVMQAGAMGNGGEVFVLDMGKPIKIIDLARDTITLSGFEPDKDIPIVFTQPRPGEKLFENILTAEEGTSATKHEKIFEAKISAVNSEQLHNKLYNLKNNLHNYQKQELKEILNQIVTSSY